MDEEQQDYLNSDVNRFTEEEVNRIKAMRDEDDMMLEIIEKLQTIQKLFLTLVNILPLYTPPKTPRVEYDRFPLVAVTGVFRWGFRGLNYHWGEMRNYTWEELQNVIYIRYIPWN